MKIEELKRNFELLKQLPTDFDYKLLYKALLGFTPETNLRDFNTYVLEQKYIMNKGL